MTNKLQKMIGEVSKKIAVLEEQLSSLKEERERLCLADNINKQVGLYEDIVSNEEESFSLKEKITALFSEKREMSVIEVFEKIKEQNEEVEKPVVNSTLYILMKKGILKKAGHGIYAIAKR